MGFDFGEALASGVAAGAGEYARQEQEASDDERWLKRQQAMQAIEAQNRQATERYLMGLKPPETRKLNVTGADGKPMIQQQEWKLTGDKGDWQNVGDATPDINFERLAETQKNNEERNRLTGDRNAALADAAAARIDMARERLAAEQSRKQGRTEEPKAYTTTDPKTGKPVQVYGWFDSDGKFTPAKDASGNPLGGDKFRPSVFQEKNDAKQAQVDSIKGTLSQFASAIGLTQAADALPTMKPGSSPAPAAQPQPAAAKPATPYREGQVIYDKQGRKYVVQNGVPVPAQ